MSGEIGSAADLEPRMPPVTQLGMVSLALIVIAVIYLAAYMPEQVPLTAAVILLIASAALLAINLALLARVRGFHWRSFFQTAGWALLAYVITAGIIEYAFVRNGLDGDLLAVLTLSLAIYAVHVPVLIGFTVARYN